jgi:hypothetical protein
LIVLSLLTILLLSLVFLYRYVMCVGRGAVVLVQ